MSVTQAYGANIAFIEELYERYRANPESVSASWREFFKGNEVAELQGSEVAEETPAATQQPSIPTPPPPPKPTPVPPLAPGATPLRGAEGSGAGSERWDGGG